MASEIQSSSVPLVQERRLTALLATAAMIGSAAAWGFGTVMSKAALSTLPPVTLLVIQLLASIAVLWVGVALSRVPFHISQVRHGWTGVFEPGTAYLIGIIGINITTASNASLINAMEPFLIVALAFLFLRQKVSSSSLMLMIVSTIGVLMVVSLPAQADSPTLLGDVLEFTATGAAAVYVILSSRSVKTVHPLPLAASQQTVGFAVALIALPIALALGEASRLGALSLGIAAFAALTGIIQYSIAFTLYLTALKTIAPSKAGLYLTLIPVFGVGGAVLFLGETLSLIQLLGAGLIIASLAAANLLKQNEKV